MKKIYQLETKTSDECDILLTKAYEKNEIYLMVDCSKDTFRAEIKLQDLLGELISKGIVGISLNYFANDNI